MTEKSMQSHLEFRQVSKRYRLGRRFASLRDLFSGGGRGGPTTAEDGRGEHWAVREVSFELEPGQALGIIGPNGAGKTTILKLLSRVTQPTSGSIHINGRLSALIELGAGFHPDLTGSENIFLNGVILGMSRAQIQQRYDQIVEFSGISQYLDTPVKRYSSGMYARLGFSIAAHVDPQILLVDEVLAVGDFAFQTKCYARMDELRRQGTSLIFISHNMDAIRRVCDRGLVMYRGRAIYQGDAAAAVVAYSDAVREAARAAGGDVPIEGGLSQRVMTFDAEIAAVQLLDGDGQPTTTLTSGDAVTLALDVTFARDVTSPIFAFFVRTTDGQLVYNTTTQWMNLTTPDFKAGERTRVTFQLKLPLLEGTYELGADIAAADLSHFYDRVERALTFWVQDRSGARGLVDLGARVAFADAPAPKEALP
jgi:ABC-type polysaccharide/polyol phosphate transport system ATPase subunit